MENIELREDEKGDTWYYNEHDALVCELMFLCYLINTRTNLCCFLDMSGHVGKLEVSIRQGKADGKYEKRIKSWDWLLYYMADREKTLQEKILDERKERLLEVITYLKELLEENEVDYKSLNPCKVTE